MEQKFKIFHEYVFIVFITLYISNETWIGATFILRLAFSAYPNVNAFYAHITNTKVILWLHLHLAFGFFAPTLLGQKTGHPPSFIYQALDVHTGTCLGF